MSAADEIDLPEYAEALSNNGFLPIEGELRYQLLSCMKRNNKNAVFLLRVQDCQTNLVLKVSKGTLNMEQEFNMLMRFCGVQGLRIPLPIAYWWEDDKQYLLRSYLPGMTLGEYIDERDHVDEKKIRGIGSKVCDCLMVFHNAGVVLRDIKPDNVIIQDDGEIALIDLGTLRKVDPARQHDTVYLGTESFAAPEQFGYAQTDNRTDIYGLGMLLLTLCTGEADRRELHGSPVSHRLKRIIRKCISFDPKQRYASAEQVKRKLTPRRKALFYIGILTAVVLAVVGAFALYPRSAPQVMGNIVYNQQVYDTLSDAVAAIPKWTSGEIILSGDIVLQQPVRIDSRNVTISGSAVIADTPDFTAIDSGMLTIEPKAKLTLKEGIVVKSGYGAMAIYNNGTFTLDGASVSSWDSDLYGAALFNGGAGQIHLIRGEVACSLPEEKDGWLVFNGGQLVFDGGLIRGYGFTGGVLNTGVARCNGGYIEMHIDGKNALCLHNNENGVSIGEDTVFLVNDVRVN